MIGKTSRIVAQFSCGAASAVATKLTLTEFGASHEVILINAFIEEEDEDNRRFADDCARWFGRPLEVVRDEKYNASAMEVFRRERYMVGPRGAPCTRALKRKVLDAKRLPGDVVVLGYTAEEEGRLEDFRDRFPDVPVHAPLILRGLSKADCKALVLRQGIALPRVYEHFENANCIGCVKGGQGYWNKVRSVYPMRFQAMADLQEEIGDGAYFFRDRATGRRYGLKDLDPASGRHNESAPECSIFCELAASEVVDA